MCLCVAYENLRASQEEFFKKRNNDVESESLKESDRAERELEEAIDEGLRIQDLQIEDGSGDLDPDSELGCSSIKRRRDKLLEEARKSVPKRGKVMHLVQAFEKLLSIPSSKDSDEQKEEEEAAEKIVKKVEKWTLPRLQPSSNAPETQCLLKPPVKEITIPTYLKLHSNMRAVERAEFDHQVAEKMSLFEQYKMERERLRKLAEEEEIRRLVKELVLKAQPMPYFDRPFIPRRVCSKVSCASKQEDQVLLVVDRYELLHLQTLKPEEDDDEQEPLICFSLALFVPPFVLVNSDH